MHSHMIKLGKASKFNFTTTNNTNDNYHNSSNNSHDHDIGGQGKDGQGLETCVVPQFVIVSLSLFYCTNDHYY